MRYCHVWLTVMFCASLCWLIACGGNALLDGQGQTDAQTSIDQPDAQTLPETAPEADARVPMVDAGPDVLLADAETEAGEPLFPNYIEFYNCDSDPDESALPNDAPYTASCNTIKAIAWHCDAEQAVQIPCSFTWSVDDQAVAQLVLTPGAEDGNTQHLATGLDLFKAGIDQEPWAQVMVCVIPLSAPPNTVDPVCGQLPIHAVVNLNGAWDFSGLPFGAATYDFQQDGRYVHLDGTGQGTIYARHLDFYWHQWEFTADLSDPNHMTGTFKVAGTQDSLGDWSAVRAP